MASSVLTTQSETFTAPVKEPVSQRGPRYYRPELDALRFAAFFAVYIHHGIYSFLPVLSRFGAYGLSLFFFLSAFLITELLQREKQRSGTIQIRNFYIRRTLRIWPLYYGFLLFTIVLAVLVPSYKAPVGFMVCFFFMVGNIYSARYNFPNNPASFLWSISVEEQFYLFWPLLNRICSRRTLAVIAASMLPVGSITALILWRMHASANLGIWCNTLVEFQFFGIGTLVSLALAGRIPQIPGTRRVLLVLGGVILWWIAARYTGINNFGPQSAFGPVLGYYIVGAGCIAIFLGIYGLPQHRLPKLLVYLGKISYGLYVFHEFSLEMAERIMNAIMGSAGITSHTFFGVGHILLGFIFTLVIAWASYRFFESPFLRLKESFTVVRSRTV